MWGWLPPLPTLPSLAPPQWPALLCGFALCVALLLACLLRLLALRITRARTRKPRGGALLGQEQGCEVHRSRVIEAQFYLRSSEVYRLHMLLPQIGTRRDRCFCQVRLIARPSRGLVRRFCRRCCLGLSTSQLMSVSTCGDAPAMHDEQFRISLREMLVSRSRHPLLAPIHWFDVLPSARLAVVVRDWLPSGSLRDRMHGTYPSAPISSKYNLVGTPLSEHSIQKYGWQLLQAR